MGNDLTPAALSAAIKAVAACIGPNCEGAMRRAVAEASAEDGGATPANVALRDQFAMNATLYFLQEFDTPVEGWAEYVAGAAYHLADAMLAERAK